MSFRKKPDSLADTIKTKLEQHPHAGRDENWSELYKVLSSDETREYFRSFEKSDILRKKSRNNLIRFAAAIVLLISSVLFFFQYQSDFRLNHQFSTTDSVSYIDLPDYSRVFLNKNSMLRYPGKFSKNERRVQLDGEGYFIVHPDSQIPFKIVTTHAEIEVLGTEFNVKSYAHQKDQVISVHTGRVAVRTFGAEEEIPFVLGQNESCIILKEDSLIAHTGNNDPNDFSWKTREIVFVDTPILEVAETLEDYYSCSIVLLEGDYDSISLTGTYSHMELDQLMRTVCLTLNLKFESKNDTLIVSR